MVENYRQVWGAKLNKNHDHWIQFEKQHDLIRGLLLANQLAGKSTSKRAPSFIFTCGHFCTKFIHLKMLVCFLLLFYKVKNETVKEKILSSHGIIIEESDLFLKQNQRWVKEILTTNKETWLFHYLFHREIEIIAPFNINVDANLTTTPSFVAGLQRINETLDTIGFSKYHNDLNVDDFVCKNTTLKPCDDDWTQIDFGRFIDGVQA